MSDDTNEYVIDVRLGSVTNRVIEHGPDPFAQEGEELVKYKGVDTSLRRKVSRELKKRYEGKDGTPSKRHVIQDITGYNLFDVVIPPMNLDYLARLYELSAPHAAAIKAKVSNIVGLGYDFVETERTKLRMESKTDAESTAKARRTLARRKLDMHEWLSDCNVEDEFQETMQKVWTDYETVGNGYLEIGRDIQGIVRYIGHIPATTMRIRKKRDGFVQVMSHEAIFFRNFGDTTTPNPVGGDNNPNEVIHFKKYSPTSEYYGMPDILSALTAVTGNEFSAKFNLDYFENKAVPRYVVITKGGTLNDAGERRLLEFFQGGLKGQNHRTLYVPLPAEEQGRKVDFEMKPVEAGTQDSSFDNYRRGNLNEILMAHRVPISKIAVMEGSLAIAKDADKTFKEQVCRPEQRIAERKLNKIIKELTDIFELKLNELSLTDAETQAKIDEIRLRQDVVTPNEVRARDGLSALPNGDKTVGVMSQAEEAAKVSQQAAEQRAQTNGTRARDQARSNNSTDSASSTNTRAPQGEGRQQG